MGIYLKKLKFPVLGQVRDVEGALWNVRDVRDTKHGFDLLFGSPETRVGYNRCGLPQLIATQPLLDYWEANSAKHDGVLFDLPAGRTTLKRVRHRFGFNYHHDASDFWNEHIVDLEELSPREFAIRHNLNVCVVSQAALKLLGRRTRKLGWWRKPKPLGILRSNITLREMGEKLGISISQAHRLSKGARQATVTPIQWLEPAA